MPLTNSKRASLIALAALCACLLAAQTWAADAVGWRTDGTGKYLDANPTVEWSPDSNVIWKTPMPNWSNSTPIIVGDRLFVCAEKSTLLCVGLGDGEILWQRSNELTDLVDADEAARITAAQKAGAELRARIGKAQGEMRKLSKQSQDKPDDADLKAKVDTAKKQIADMWKQLQPYNNAWYSLPDVDATNGFTSATPVSDGEKVWAVFGTGLVVCYDLEGNKLWGRVVEKPTIGYGPCASPIIVGDKLLVHLRSLTALDPETGETIWQTKAEHGFGTTATARIGDTDVAITAKGDIVRVDDGKLLAKSLAKLEYCGPVVEDGVVYFIQHGGKAFKLPETIENDSLAAETLWQTKPRKDRYYGSPVVHEGLIYACAQKNQFSVIDAETGQVVYEQRLDMGKGTCYPSVTMAGDLLFVSSDNGTTCVVKPGREYQEVARNKLELFRSSPVFVGDRLYIRTYKNLYCLGETGEQ